MVPALPALPDITIELVANAQHFHAEASGDDGKAASNDAINWLIAQFQRRYGLYGFRIG